MTEVLARHFSEWGPVEDISIKTRIRCCFIRFRNRIYAEFARVMLIIFFLQLFLGLFHIL